MFNFDILSKLRTKFWVAMLIFLTTVELIWLTGALIHSTPWSRTTPMLEQERKMPVRGMFMICVYLDVCVSWRQGLTCPRLWVCFPGNTTHSRTRIIIRFTQSLISLLVTMKLLFALWLFYVFKSWCVHALVFEQNGIFIRYLKCMSRTAI